MRDAFIDHLVIAVADLERSRRSYRGALEPFGVRELEVTNAAALEAGGTDNGPPGLRPKYHEHYYEAFVIDPDGNNVEAVCHDPQ